MIQTVLEKHAGSYFSLGASYLAANSDDSWSNLLREEESHMNYQGLIVNLSQQTLKEVESWEVYQSRGYFAELDGLRAFSIAVVVAHHMHDDIWGWLNGPLGVTVFFVVSGFLITTLAIREERKKGRFCFAAFYIRRSLRIFPSYYLTLGLYCLMILGLGVLPRARQSLVDALPYYLTYFQEIPLFFRIESADAAPFRQAWSLGIEEKFYLVWPILIFGFWKSRRQSRLIGTATLAIAFAATPALSLVGQANLGRALVPYSSILVGCLVALLLEDRAWFERVAFLGRQLWNWLLLALVVILHFAIDPDRPIALAAYSVAVGAFLVSLLISPGPIRSVLSRKELVTLGRLSYGIYLLHYFAIYAAQKIARPGTGHVEVGVLAFVLTMLFASILAWVMAALVERPFIALGRKWSSKVMDAVDRRLGDDHLRTRET